MLDEKYEDLVDGKAPWGEVVGLSKRERKKVENALRPCPCGGIFKFDNDLLCPKCKGILAKGPLEGIYVYILAQRIDGEKSSIWK
jgi:hypothetical protein